MVFIVAVFFFLFFFSVFYLVSLSCTRSIFLVPNPVCVNQLSHCHETPSSLVQPQHRSAKGDEYAFYDPSAIPHLPFPLPNSLPMSRRPCPSLHSPPSPRRQSSSSINYLWRHLHAHGGRERSGRHEDTTFFLPSSLLPRTPPYWTWGPWEQDKGKRE